MSRDVRGIGCSIRQWVDGSKFISAKTAKMSKRRTRVVSDVVTGKRAAKRAMDIELLKQFLYDRRNEGKNTQ